MNAPESGSGPAAATAGTSPRFPADRPTAQGRRRKARDFPGAR